MSRLLGILLSLAFCLTLFSCASEPEKQENRITTVVVKEVPIVKDTNERGLTVSQKMRNAFLASDAIIDDRGDETVVRMVGMVFPFGSSKLTSENKIILDKLGKNLQELGDRSLKIEGHTDRFGPQEYNERLSLMRAREVANYLAQNFDLSPQYIQVIGHANTDPIRSGDTLADRRANRRIDVIISSMGTDQLAE